MRKVVVEDNTTILKWLVKYVCVTASQFSPPVGTEAQIVFDHYNILAFSQLANPGGWEITSIERFLVADR